MAVQHRLAARQPQELARAALGSFSSVGNGPAVHEREVARCHDVTPDGNDAARTPED